MKNKFWIFYIINKSIAENNGEFVNDVYAFTNDIELAENFINTRNMEIFYAKYVKLNKSEYNDLIRHYMTCELEWFKGTTKNKKYKIKPIKVALTRKEKMRIQSMASLTLHEEIYKYVWKNIFPFKFEYIKALKVLLYLDLQRYITDGEELESHSIYSNDLAIIIGNIRELFIDSEELE